MPARAPLAANKRIKGVWFEMQPKQLPKHSPYGTKRLIIPAEKFMLNICTMHLNGCVKDTHHYSDHDDDDNDDDDDEEEEGEEEDVDDDDYDDDDDDNEGDDDTLEKDTNYSNDIPYTRSEQHLNLEHGLHEKQMNELQGLHETSEEEKDKYIAEELTEIFDDDSFVQQKGTGIAQIESTKIHESEKILQKLNFDPEQTNLNKIQPNTNKKAKKGQSNIVDSFKYNKKIPLNQRYKREDFLRDDLEFRKASYECNLPAASSIVKVDTELPVLFFESAYIYNCGHYARFVLVRPSDCALDWCKSNLKALEILHNPFSQYNPTTRQVKSTSKSNNGRKLLYLDFLIVGNINLHMFSPQPNWDKVTKVRRAGRDPVIGILRKKKK